MTALEIKKLAWQILMEYQKLSISEWLGRYFQPFARGLNDKEAELLADLLDVMEKFKNKVYTKEQCKSISEGYMARFENQI